MQSTCSTNVVFCVAGQDNVSISHVDDKSLEEFAHRRELTKCDMRRSITRLVKRPTTDNATYETYIPDAPRVCMFVSVGVLVARDLQGSSTTYIVARRRIVVVMLRWADVFKMPLTVRQCFSYPERNRSFDSTCSVYGRVIISFGRTARQGGAPSNLCAAIKRCQ